MDLPEPHPVELRHLIGVVTRVHDAAMTYGFHDQPLLEPILFTLNASASGRLSGMVMEMPRAVWDVNTPADVLNGLRPMPGKVPEDFCGAMLTFEAWFHTAPTADRLAVNELLDLADQRKVYTLPTKMSARITMAYTTDGQWVQFLHVEGTSAPVVSTSESAEHNPDHYKGWYASAVTTALAGLVHRIQADIDARHG